MKNIIASLILSLLMLPHLISGQGSPTNVLEYEVNRIHPPIALTKAALHEANTLLDLNSRYPSSWIREYLSVEILAIHQGQKKKARGKNDTLSLEQKNIMYQADSGTDISVIVHYMPENNLKHNDPKKIAFSVSIDPETHAQYPGGQEQLLKYVKKNAVDKIQDGILTGYALAAVKFAVNEEGIVTDAQIFWTSEDKKTDEILLETICNMPNWKPAEYADGTRVRQEFAFTVGNMESCVVNLLNIYPSRFPAE